MDDNNLQLQISDQLFFEMILLEIRGKTISYATYRKKEDRKREENLEKEIEKLEKDITEENLPSLERKKEALQNIRHKKVDGMIIRSRAKWIQEGEKNTKYFCSLEKRNFVEKCMPYLETSQGELLTDQNMIKREVNSFYENLYKSRESDILDVNLNNITQGPKLTVDEKTSIEGNITVVEALEALKKMENNKSPGSDGYTAEFYKKFWSDLGIFLVRSINESFDKGEMSVTQRQGIITCIPKDSKEKKFLKNWRPITLLNTSYKIAAACIAQRLRTVLPSIIHEGQTGFLPGRNINQNTRLLYDVLVHTDTQKIPGLLLLVDFEKAFDSIAWSFISKALDFFCFGPDIKKWICTFYNNINACVTVNGGYTGWFQIQRGVRQGDPCSPYLYLICAEILSLLIRNNVDIKGIKIAEDTEALLSQFVDDTTLFLDGSRKCFEETINCLNYFSAMSGLKLNIEKTQVVWIGKEKKITNKIYAKYKLYMEPRCL